MRLEANQISRDWTILHGCRRFCVNYTESDGQTLALMNRDNWEVLEDSDDGLEELNVCVFKDATAKERRIAAENTRLKEQLVRFCIENWDNEFMQAIRREVAEQGEVLARL